MVISTDRPVPALKVARVSRGLRQRDLARLSGVRRETISVIETGHSPSLRTAHRLAAALGYPVDLVFPIPEDLPVSKAGIR